MSKATETYREELIAVNELEIDRRVQRDGLNKVKVRKIVREYNPGALGVVTVSYRKDRSLIIIDGWHRVEATRIKTDNVGELKCHVFGRETHLTLAEEAQMFLDLNTTTQPPVLDKFRVSTETEGEVGDAARDIQDLVGAYGFKISNVAANGNINAVKVVVRMYDLSRKIEAEPNLVHVTCLVIARAWGNDRYGTQGSIFEAIARIFAEYGSRIDLDRFIDTVKMYDGGPQSLIAAGTALAALRKGKVSMAIAELLVDGYNKGKRTGLLEQWRKRT